MIVFVDGLVAGFSMEDARVIYLSKAEGYNDLARKLEDGTFSVVGYKLVILLVGRENVWDTDKRFLTGVDDIIKAVQNQDDRVIIILGATLPSPGDTKPMIGSFSFRNDKLVAKCNGEWCLEHACPGHHLLGPRGPIPDYFDEYGNVNKLGGDVIARALERKIFSAKLFQKYDNQVEDR